MKGCPMKTELQSSGQSPERMSDFAFRLMSLTFSLIDRLSHRVERRSRSFGLRPGMTVVDYGCGPGRYTQHFAKAVGAGGKVFAVDNQELALHAVGERIAHSGLRNVQPVLAWGYDTGLPGAIADRIFALDVFHGIRQPVEFLAELRRLVKPDGMLVIDAGHQSRNAARRKILGSGDWRIEAETRDHLECRPA